MASGFDRGSEAVSCIGGVLIVAVGPATAAAAATATVTVLGDGGTCGVAVAAGMCVATAAMAAAVAAAGRQQQQWRQYSDSSARWAAPDHLNTAANHFDAAALRWHGQQVKCLPAYLCLP